MMGRLSFGGTGLSYKCNEVKLQVGNSPRCQRCEGRVYFNEEKRALGKVWHDRCFTCVSCQKRLDSTSVNGHDDEIYCNTCHKREFGARGYGYAAGAAGPVATTNGLKSYSSASSSSSSSSSPTSREAPSRIPAPPVVDITDKENCPKCGKRVYFAEEVRAHGRKWHHLCFKCDDCRRMLEKGRSDEHDGTVYCGACYTRNHGPKGYGFAGGAGTGLSSDNSRLKQRRNHYYSANGIRRRVREEPEKNPVYGTKEWTEAVFI